MIKRRVKTPEEIETNRQEQLKLWAFFTLLWRKLPAVKTCWNCGKRIFGENLTIYWDHLLPKADYPELKYEEENMFFCCADCHTNKGNGFPGEKHKAAIEKAKQTFNI